MHVTRARNRHRQHAFTLIEILMALAILSFALLPLAIFVRSGSKTVAGTRDIATAVFLAQRTLEECRSYPFELLLRGPSTPAGGQTAEEAMNASSSFEFAKVAYKREVKIRELAAGAGFGGRLLHVRVSWQADPEQKQLEYQTWTVLSPLR